METVKPVRLYARLRAVHQRGQLLNVLSGLLVLCRWTVVLFLAAFAVDWMLHLPVPVRVVVLALLLGVSVYRAWRGGWQYLTSCSLARCALKVEDHYKDLESLLITGVQLDAERPLSGTSASLCELAARKADEAAAALEVKAVVPYRGLRQPAVTVGLFCAGLCVFAVVNAPLLMAGLTRIFAPWQAADYPTRTHIDIEHREIVVKEGDPVQIRARLSGEVPKTARLALLTGKGRPHTRNLDVADNACEYNLAAAFRSFEYSISAGDAESGWHTVKVVSSPRVTTTQVRLLCPPYMGRLPETLEAMTLTVPEGARVEWNLRLDRPVSRAAFSIEGGKPIPLEVSEDGFTVRHGMEVSASGAYAFSWVDKEYGFSFDTAKHYLQVAPDQPPQIELVSPHRNLFATLGRKLVLAYRARDDHGIGEAKVVCRRNNAGEQQIPFPSKASEGRSVQDIAWDYRDAFEDLDIGDSVTFAIEVSDLYPAPDGPHRVRSESRRVSFLSRDDYLEKIHEQKKRLLSQLRTLYRQERAAYDVIRTLAPPDEAFGQTCFLESSRQDILTERITVLSAGIGELVDDLLANNIEEKSESEGLNKLQVSLEGISTNFIREAASQLRDLGPSAKGDPQAVARAAGTINNAARELGSLVLQLGVHEAMEVFAMELHVIARSQNALRAEIVESAGKDPALSARQKELASWIEDLLKELGERRDYSESPVTIVRLARMIKDLRNARIASAMHNAAGAMDRGNLAEAVRLQHDILSKVFQLECTIRVGAEYEALLNARDILTSGINALKTRGGGPNDISLAEARHSLSALQRRVRRLILPAIPAPEPGLLAEKPTDVPPVDELLVSLQDSLQHAVESMQAGKADASRSQLQQVAAALQTLHDIVERRLREVTRTVRYAGNSGAAADRSTMIRELLASQMRLTEKTEDAQYYKTNGAYLAPSQLHLSGEVLRTRDRLDRKNQNKTLSSRIVSAMLQMLKEASDAMTKAGPPLQADKLGDALEQQDLALDALQAAMAFSDHESSGWLALANLLMTAEGMALPASYMKDIVAEQRDLIAETEKSTPESRIQLLEIQKNLGRAVFDVSMLVQGTGSGLDFEQAMIFAGSDMGLSAQKLENGDVSVAMQAQSRAVESVADLIRQFETSEKQFHYFVTVMEFLQAVHTDGVVFLNKLTELREVMEGADDRTMPPHVQALNVLRRESEEFCMPLLLATGRKDYGTSRASLTRAVKALKAGERDACLDEITSAEDALKANLDELRELMGHIAYIPSVLPVEASQEYAVMLDMVDLAVQEKDLAFSVYRAKPDELAAYVPALSELVETVGELAGDTRQHAFVVGAHKSVTEALNHLKASSGAEAYSKLHEADALLRQCILEYALYYIEPKSPRGSRRRKKGKSGIVTLFKMSNLMKPAYDRNYGGVEGEDPQAGRSEWEVLGRRDRASLNENFVRELPLEYREFLKDYYERLTQ